ncbi:SMP-30/gluconolactonase/LRE family protein [Salinisphaera sp. USBA-960]|uniref:SMP-30/gluconolactonase/LRE family protein n=1 Tax=Salinisphaera orenii TaxID=856731 RepID=UPI000DBEA121|nr:SMP-30/gluconolactonase/LRE family protein [Salifodinibacter halophilus]NNC25784.1 SMP-30/gluconolactonase/LRE family protein [Salifodinibacter halophilus]
MTLRSTTTSFVPPGSDGHLSAIASLDMALGESPLWDAQRRGLWWVDIDGCALHFAHPDDGRHWRADYDEAIGCVGLRADGGLIAGTRSGLRPIDETGVMQPVVCANPENTANHRFNDGRIGPDGRFWLGTLADDKTTPDAGLYSWDGHGLTAHKNDLVISNGLAFSPDARICYHSDTPRRLVYRHSFDAETGKIGPGEVWIDFNQLDLAGNPDGAAVDANGHYWCALFGGFAVARFDPAGQLHERYPLAAPNPTMCSFGGADRQTLFVTTAREGMTHDAIAQWPNAGGLFAARTNVAGIPEPTFQARHDPAPGNSSTP